MKSSTTITIIIAAIVLGIILLFPSRLCYDDGGSVEYRAILYSYTDVKRFVSEADGEMGYLEGTVIKILGIEVYNDVE